jgi:hypothetical protein
MIPALHPVRRKRWRCATGISAFRRELQQERYTQLWHWTICSSSIYMQQLHAGAVGKAYGMAFPVPNPPRTPTPAAPAPRPARVSPANKFPDIDPRLCISSSKVQSPLSVQPVVQHGLSADCPVPWPTAASAQPCVGDSAAQQGARSYSAAAVCVYPL